MNIKNFPRLNNDALIKYGRVMFYTLILAASLSEMAAFYGVLSGHKSITLGWVIICMICAFLAVAVYIAWERLKSDERLLEEMQKQSERIDPNFDGVL